MKYKRSVYKTLSLISQVGISMLTPIFLCVFLGVWLDGKFSTNLFIPLLLLGIGGGFRSVYTITKHANEDKEPKDDKEDR